MNDAMKWHTNKFRVFLFSPPHLSHVTWTHAYDIFCAKTHMNMLRKKHGIRMSLVFFPLRITHGKTVGVYTCVYKYMYVCVYTYTCVRVNMCVFVGVSVSVGFTGNDTLYTQTHNIQTRISNVWSTCVHTERAKISVCVRERHNTYMQTCMCVCNCTWAFVCVWVCGCA